MLPMVHLTRRLIFTKSCISKITKSFFFYMNGLLELKKFDEAISAAKKMVRKHPADRQYSIMLATAYAQQGSVDKANAIYDDLVKNLPPDQSQIALLASLFYQNANVDYAIKIFLQGRKLLQNDM